MNGYPRLGGIERDEAGAEPLEGVCEVLDVAGAAEAHGGLEAGCNVRLVVILVQRRLRHVAVVVEPVAVHGERQLDAHRWKLSRVNLAQSFKFVQR